MSKFEVSSGTMESAGGGASWTHVFANALIDLARADERIVAITAAMAGGTGLDLCQRVFPDRFYDVGEGLGGVTVSVAGAGSVTTFDSGGYSIPLAPGSYTVTASGGYIRCPPSVRIVSASRPRRS